MLPTITAADVVRLKRMTSNCVQTDDEIIKHVHVARLCARNWAYFLSNQRLAPSVTSVVSAPMPLRRECLILDKFTVLLLFCMMIGIFNGLLTMRETHYTTWFQSPRLNASAVTFSCARVDGYVIHLVLTDDARNDVLLCSNYPLNCLRGMTLSSKRISVFSQLPLYYLPVYHFHILRCNRTSSVKISLDVGRRPVAIDEYCE